VVDVDRRALGQLRSLRGRHDDQIRRLLRKCVELGTRTQDIAEALGISRSTLWRHYGDELRRNDPDH
jgi:DNA invertase Pin-like site-specific DNA recombinase